MFRFQDEDDELQWDEYGAAPRPHEFQLFVSAACFLLLTVDCVQGAAGPTFPFEDEDDELQWVVYGAALSV